MAKQNEGGTTGWRKQTIIMIEGAVGQGEPAVDKTEIDSISETELGETTIIRLKHADGCGHVIHVASEVGGICVCGRVLCAKCAQTTCYRCGRPVCGEHIRRVKKDDAELIYCWRCWPWTLLEGWQGIWRWLLGGLLVLFLLKLFRGC